MASFVGRRDGSTFLADGFFGNSMLLPNRNLQAAYQLLDLSGRYAINRHVSAYFGTVSYTHLDVYKRQR